MGKIFLIPVYVSEVVTPIEIVGASHRVKYFDTWVNNNECRIKLELEDLKLQAS